MDLWDDLAWRGLALQWTGGSDELRDRLRAGPITLYGGFDPTADSLQVGNLVGITMLRRFQRAGHRPIVLMGGATGMIGDPSGKSEERTLMGPDEIGRNVELQRAQFERLLDFSHGAALLVNNADWTRPVLLLDFLRDVGKHVPVNVMLARESVRARLGSTSGISFAEFAYMLLQAYDFVHLHREVGCELQIGGSDQFGNIAAGVDLARRMDGAQLWGLTHPLVTDAAGEKLGKTEGGAVWLDPRRTSPYAFFQYWMRTEDRDVGGYLRSLSERPREEIEALEKAAADAPEKREAQRALAAELTHLVHGPDGLRKAERATEALFGGDLQGLTEADLLEIFADVPSRELPRARLDSGLPAVDALGEAGLALSRGQARRVLEGGGGYVNSRRISGPDAVLTAADLASETVMVLRSGKRSFALLRFRRESPF